MAKGNVTNRDSAAADPATAAPVAAARKGVRSKPAGVKARAAIKTTEPTVVEDGASLEADRVAVLRTAVGRVEASTMTVGQGLVGAARTDSLSVDRGLVGAAMADHVEVSRGYARSILARQVQLDRAAARVVIAANVEAKQSAVMFLIARRVGGDVRVLFDWRGAIAFGAVAGVLIGLISRARRPRS